jgi:hypothetical protein
LAGGLALWYFCYWCFFLAAAFVDAVESVLVAAVSPASFGMLESDLFCDIDVLGEVLYMLY